MGQYKDDFVPQPAYPKHSRTVISITSKLAALKKQEKYDIEDLQDKNAAQSFVQ